MLQPHLFEPPTPVDPEGIHQLDAEAFLCGLPPESIDLTVTDPAYESLERHRSKGTTTRLAQSKSSSNDWFGVVSNERLWPILEALYRAHKPMTHAYIICDDPTAEVVRHAARDAGWWVWKSLTWCKVKSGACVDGKSPAEACQRSVRIGMGYHWRTSTERIVMLEKRTKPQVSQAQWTVRKDPTGKGRKLNRLGWPDIIFAPRAGGDYPTQKPQELLEPLVLNSSAEREVVCDPFAGSGSTGIAAKVARRRWVLNDIANKSIAAMRAAGL
jgi:site-specific DNA-methyltransferase (adenine-specific)